MSSLSLEMFFVNVRLKCIFIALEELDEYILRLLHPTNAAGAGQAERAYAKLAY